MLYLGTKKKKKRQGQGVREQYGLRVGNSRWLERKLHWVASGSPFPVSPTYHRKTTCKFSRALYGGHTFTISAYCRDVVRVLQTFQMLWYIIWPEHSQGSLSSFGHVTLMLQQGTRPKNPHVERSVQNSFGLFNKSILQDLAT